MFSISEVDRHDYVRLDPAKVNITRKSQKAKWFRLVGVRLDNGTKADEPRRRLPATRFRQSSLGRHRTHGQT
jgi:hypothetical protein